MITIFLIFYHERMTDDQQANKKKSLTIVGRQNKNVFQNGLYCKKFGNLWSSYR